MPLQFLLERPFMFLHSDNVDALGLGDTLSVN